MGWNPAFPTFLAFLAAGILAVLVVVGWRRRHSRLQVFPALMAALAVWVVLYGIQLGFSTTAEQLPWQRLAMATSGTVPVVFFLFAVQYAGIEERLDGWMRGLLVGESVVFAALTLSNPVHGLVWHAPALDRVGPVSVLDLPFGAGYYAHILFAYVVVALGLWTILRVYFQSSRIHRNQSALLLSGAAPAFVSHILYTAKSSPVPALDLTPFVFAFTGVTFGLALFHFDLLERTPVAQRRAIERTGDGLIVVDSDGSVVDTNSVARQVYDLDSTTATHVSDVAGTHDPGELDGTTVTSVVDGTRRTYDLYISELTADLGLQAGFAVVLRDVTGREAYEQRLEVANRVLRHNLRNEMTVILEHAAHLSETAETDEQRRVADVIGETAEELVALSERAQQMATIERPDAANRVTVDVCEAIRPLVTAFDDQHPGVTVSLVCPSGTTAVVSSERALLIALRNLLENAVQHNDNPDPVIDVSAWTDETRTRVQVSDNGSGLPETERNVLENHTETPLEHSDGLGLWVTYWVVETTGGDVSVDASDATGTTITLSFPRTTSPAG